MEPSELEESFLFWYFVLLMIAYTVIVKIHYVL